MPLDHGFPTAVQGWAYRLFLAGQLGLIIGIFYFWPYGFLNWLFGSLPWGPRGFSFVSNVSVWVTVWGWTSIGLFLLGQALSAGAAAFELRRVETRLPKPPGGVAWPDALLEEASFRTLRAVRRWLVVEGALTYAIGLYVALLTQCFGRFCNPWLAASVLLYTGISFFALALLPAYFLSIDMYRSRRFDRRGSDSAPHRPVTSPEG